MAEQNNNNNRGPKLYTPRSFKESHRDLAAELKKEFPNGLRFDISTFQNLMPLFLVGEASHAVMTLLMNGDNWRDVLVDLFSASALTQDEGDAAGVNVDNLTAFMLFGDFRLDRRERKLLPGGSDNELAIVKAQASMTKALARMMKYVSGINNLVTLDGHSHLATTHFQEVGIEVINLTAVFSAIKDWQARGLLDDKLNTKVVGIDFGNLAIVDAVTKKFGFDRAIIRKFRQTVDGGARTHTKHELIDGDVEGSRVLLLDDIFSSGGTMLDTTRMLLEKKAREVLVFATHPVYGGTAYYAILQRLLEYKEVKIAMSTNSIPMERREFGGDKSPPYIPQTDDQGNVNADRRVEDLDITPLTKQTIHSLLASGGDIGKMRKLLIENTVTQEDPYDIYHRMTGKKIEKPRDIAVYRRGKFYSIPDVTSK